MHHSASQSESTTQLSFLNTLSFLQVQVYIQHLSGCGARRNPERSLARQIQPGVSRLGTTNTVKALYMR